MGILILPLRSDASLEEKAVYEKEVYQAKQHFKSLGIECIDFDDSDEIKGDHYIKSAWIKGAILSQAAKCDGTVLRLHFSVGVDKVAGIKTIKPLYTDKETLVIRDSTIYFDF